MKPIKTFVTIADLYWNILKAKWTKKRQPIFLSLFITNRCNLRCEYCFVVDEQVSPQILMAEYSGAEVFKIVDEFYAMGTRMIFILGGEPLLHKNIGQIIDYIIAKGIYLHVVTNGTLIKNKIDEIKNVHGLCISLDGLSEQNDALRGQGSFEKVVEGVKIAKAAGIPCRIHAVITRFNLHEIRSLAQLAKDLKVTLTISPPNFLGQTNKPYLKITQDEYKEFWKEYYQLCKERFPIGNIPQAITKCLNWPIDYHSYIKPGERYPNYNPIFCLNGYTYVALGAEGIMYNCINRGCLNGPNAKELGIPKAWDMLLAWRKDCVSCSSINCIETAMMLNLSFHSLITGIDFHIKNMR
jgi:MoaA/NifB/PqqE/SkfB family radical SAM enzyme